MSINLRSTPIYQAFKILTASAENQEQFYEVREWLVEPPCEKVLNQIYPSHRIGDPNAQVRSILSDLDNNSVRGAQFIRNLLCGKARTLSQFGLRCFADLSGFVHSYELLQQVSSEEKKNEAIQSLIETSLHTHCGPYNGIGHREGFQRTMETEMARYQLACRFPRESPSLEEQWDPFMSGAITLFEDICKRSGTVIEQLLVDLVISRHTGWIHVDDANVLLSGLQSYMREPREEPIDELRKSFMNLLSQRMKASYPFLFLPTSHEEAKSLIDSIIQKINNVIQEAERQTRGYSSRPDLKERVEKAKTDLEKILPASTWNYSPKRPGSTNQFLNLLTTLTHFLRMIEGLGGPPASSPFILHGKDPSEILLGAGNHWYQGKE